jgi:hypothetical protein
VTTVDSSPQPYAPVTPEEAARNRQVLLDALREHDRAMGLSPRARRTWRDRIAREPSALLAAAHLVTAVTIGDRAGAEALLCRPRTRREWRQLVLVLASAADPEKIPAVPKTAPRAA